MIGAAVFAIAGGILMIGQWTLTIARGEAPGPADGAGAGRYC
jgi:hypothetical protein